MNINIIRVVNHTREISKMENTEFRKYLVRRLYLQKKTQFEIVDALTEAGCVNPSGKPWSQQLISKDIKEFEATFTEKNVEQLVEIKFKKFFELEEIQRLCIEKNDMKNALQAIKQQVELLGLNSPLRSEISFSTNAQDDILKKLDSYLIKND